MSGGQAHTDIPIVVTTGGDALERHTAAMVRWDSAGEFLAHSQCAHLVRKPVIHFRNVTDLRRALRGTGVVLTSSLYEGRMHYHAEYEGVELVADSSAMEGSEVL